MPAIALYATVSKRGSELPCRLLAGDILGREKAVEWLSNDVGGDITECPMSSYVPACHQTGRSDRKEGVFRYAFHEVPEDALRLLNAPDLGSAAPPAHGARVEKAATPYSRLAVNQIVPIPSGLCFGSIFDVVLAAA
jgi:hypothetical protein